MIKYFQAGQAVRAAYIDNFLVTGRIALAYTDFRGDLAYIVELDKPLKVCNVIRMEVSVSADQIVEVLDGSTI